MHPLLENWTTTPGQCLVCGGRGGYPSRHPEMTILCTRCGGTVRDPQRGSDWYIDTVLPIQLKAARRWSWLMVSCARLSRPWCGYGPGTRSAGRFSARNDVPMS